jgi:hypothetical protein
MKSYMEKRECFTLDQALMTKYIDQILQIEEETSQRLGTERYGAPWSRDNFYSNREGKWSFSIIIVSCGDVLAYLVSSKWDNNLHGHRMAVKLDLNTKDKVLLQKDLYHRQRNLSAAAGLYMTTAMVPEDNCSTIRYYKKEGWVELDEEELITFIEARGLECFVDKPNILVDKIPEAGHPSRAKVLKFVNSTETEI